MPSGSKIEHLGTKMLQNIRKSDLRKGAKQKHDLLMSFWMENVRFWKRGTLPDALYIIIRLVFADYNKSQNFIKNQCQNGSENDAK